MVLLFVVEKERSKKRYKRGEVEREQEGEEGMVSNRYM